MSFDNRVTRALGIEHPVLLAPMDLVSGGRLAAAVSHAGGLGLIGGGYGDGDWLDREWALAHRPAAVMLSFGDPAPFAPAIRAAGARLICQVQTLDQARQAAAAGADVIVAQGTEAGGHGQARPLFTLLPEVVDACPDVPAVAAGGIADGRGFAAALALGAEGVLVGTRFYASLEAVGHPEAKQRIVAAEGGDTVRQIVFDITRLNRWPAPYTGRVLRNAHIDRWLGREDELAKDAEAANRTFMAARAKGDFDIAAVIAGEACALIHDIPPAAEIVQRLVAEATRLTTPELRRRP